MSNEIETILTGWQKHVLNLKPPRQPNDETDARKYIYAGARRSCRRRMVLEAKHPSYFPDVDVETKAKFIRGEQREVDLRQALERAGQLAMPGFTVEGQQERVMIKDRNGRHVISGKKDCSIRWESGARWSTEFKSWAPFLTEKIHTFSDLMESPWTRSGAAQLLAYLFAKNEPMGLLVLDRPGLPRLIPVSLEEHIQIMEDFLGDAEVCVDHIEAGTLPDFHDDPEECKRCPVFGSYCNPPLKFDGAKVISDEILLAVIDRHELLKEAAHEYDGLHEQIKEAFRGIEYAIAGNFVLAGKPRRVTKAAFPDEATKKKYQVSDPKGGWTTTITRVG